jgi:hypothetical protein
MATPDSDETSATGAGVDRTDATTAVALPDELVERVEARLAYTTYDDVNEYVAVVLRETLARVEAADDDPVEMDESEITERLESLGYLDS